MGMEENNLAKKSFVSNQEELGIGEADQS